MTWMPTFLDELTDEFDYRVSYTGIDIVEDLIKLNNDRFVHTSGNNTAYAFECFDLTRVAPPRGDIIFCKDLINHLVFDDIWRLLNRFNESRSTHLVISSNRGYTNFDHGKMVGNASRHVDLEAPPFSLKPTIWGDGYLALWKLPLQLRKTAAKE